MPTRTILEGENMRIKQSQIKNYSLLGIGLKIMTYYRIVVFFLTCTWSPLTNFPFDNHRHKKEGGKRE